MSLLCAMIYKEGRLWNLNLIQIRVPAIKLSMALILRKRNCSGKIVMTPVANNHGEERQAVFGLINGKHWTAIITMRENATRIISVRRSRKKEEDYYDSKTQH